MNNEMLKDMLYFCLIGGIVLIALLVSFRLTIARLRQKNYFLNRDRERYAETMYASKDGYFAFIYPDERIKDPRRTVRERCSRRLAVMLNLKKGIRSTFDDVLEMFYRDDGRKIRKYLSLMQEEGVSFEDVFTLKNSNRGMSIFGARINGLDGNLYCDMLWFRDLSTEMQKIQQMEQEKKLYQKHLRCLTDLIDNLENPVWLRDENLKIMAINKKYAEFAGYDNLEETLSKNAELTPAGDEFSLLELAKIAQQTNKPQKKPINLVVAGRAGHFEAVETPFHSNDSLDKIGTVGMLTDITELDAVKRDFKIHQDAHLEVLSTLGTAIAIFNTQQKLVFYNKSFLKLWNLDSVFLDRNPGYGEFLEDIRNRRMLPEVSDFQSYKKEEEKLFTSLIESKEDLLHIPDGRTFRRLTAPHPNGLIFAYEDVSDRLAATRMINELVSVQQNILDNVNDAVVIFGADHRLKCCNRSYKRLWKVNEIELQDFPHLSDVLEAQKPFFNVQGQWEVLKQNMLNHILNSSSRFRLERLDGTMIEAAPVILSDESIMITYKLN